MSQKQIGLAILFLILGLPGLSMSLPVPAAAEPAANDEDPRRTSFLHIFRQDKDLSPGKVIELLGRPQRKSRQILYRRHIEQWTYDPPLGLCVEFNCILGQKPRLLNVHLLRQRKS
jgi:hypothetical protein